MATSILKGASVLVVFSDGSFNQREFLGTSTGRAKAITEAKKILTDMSKGRDIESVTVKNIWSKVGETVSLEMSTK